MRTNFYTNLLKRMEEIKPSLDKMLEIREIIIRDKNNNKFQAQWRKRFDGSFIEVMTELESLLSEYKQYQETLGKEVNSFLSISEERKIKSILNLLRKDIWFDNDVHSEFGRNENSYFRYIRGEMQLDPIFQMDSIEEAKKKMLLIIREELINSFNTKFEFARQYLFKEINSLEIKMKEITTANEKYSDFYDYGLSIINEKSTIAMILLGVSIECLFKKKYNNIIRENMTLGNIINKLNRKKILKNQIDLLNDINDTYIKAKHEKDTVVPKETVELFYQKASNFY